MHASGEGYNCFLKQHLKEWYVFCQNKPFFTKTSPQDEVFFIIKSLERRFFLVAIVVDIQNDKWYNNINLEKKSTSQNLICRREYSGDV